VGVRVAVLSGGGADAVAGARAAGADVVCLPQLSFSGYLPGVLDRAGLEQAERPVARSYRDALAAAGGAWLAASSYESEGEGVFYATAMLGRDGDARLLRHRQRRLDAEPGRWEPLLLSPGHEPPGAIALPWGPTGVLIGADVRDPASWDDLAAAGVRVLLGGVSEPDALWARTRRIVAGLAAVHGIAAVVANRGGEEHGVRFAGAGAGWDAAGSELQAGADGLLEPAGAA
jgi:predicted amidohydrolase